jgi:zinc protease
MLDRTIAPEFQEIQEVFFPEAEVLTLPNQTPLFIINEGQQPVMRLDISLPAGSWFEQKNGVSFFTTKTLGEGTTRLSNLEISELLDSYGASLEYSQGLERVSLTLYCLNKFLPQVLPLIRTLLEDAVFPDESVEIFRNISRQNLQINLEKTGFVASQTFRQRLFGQSHAYGRILDDEGIQQIHRQDLIDFYTQCFQHKKYTLFLAGNIGDTEIGLVQQILGENILNSAASAPSQSIDSSPAEALLLERPEALQSSIRLGRKLFTRTHDDYFKFLIMNEILGGYFGSRLMKNIREDKGFTYGISSRVNCFTHHGFWLIATDVKKEFTQQTLDEIQKEISFLQNDLVGSTELQTVKNYMAGAFAGSLNTPFEILDRYKTLWMEGLTSDFYRNFIHQLRAVSAEDVRQMAQKYLQPQDLLEVVVGGK